MAEILKGAPVAAAIIERTRKLCDELKDKGIVPKLAILRVGERPSDLSYEKGALKRCEQTGVALEIRALAEDVSMEEFISELTTLNEDESVHGILIMRPLPEHLDEEAARRLLKPEKDVDGCTDGSLAGVYSGSDTGFAPCTAQAAMEILHYYGVQISGKRAAVIGRSLVAGRPASMLLMRENATVTVCHSKTPDAAKIASEADILVAACGRAEYIGREYFSAEQVVVDVGINYSAEKQKMTGDCCFDEALDTVKAITPVPGGVGSVTSSELVYHAAEAARRFSENR